MSDQAVDWMKAHLAAAPPPLTDAMQAALAQTDVALTVPERMAEAALHLYARAARGSGLRDEALGLLAADALLTHAFEAQTEEAPGTLIEFARRWGSEGRLADLVGDVCR